MSTTTVLPSDPPSHPPYRPESDAVRELDAALDALDQRDLLEPALLLSAGYLALPFVAKQVLLLLAPMGALLGALLGIALPGQGESHDLPS